jgi:DNA mismatch repair protein MutS
MDASKLPTPMMAQYLAIKAAYADSLLFYRMGDFYELFFADAEIASRALGIVLTKRGKHRDEDIPMCGVPVERADDYLHRLIAQGHRVAICEQTEDPAEARKRGGKAVVSRAVVRLVTPGTLTEDGLLDPGRANLLVALARLRGADGLWLFGLAALDISTGAFRVTQVNEAALASELLRFEPSEIVVPDSLADEAPLASLLKGLRIPLAAIGREAADAATAEQRVCRFFKVATLAGFGGFSRAELAAAACAIAYVERTQLAGKPSLLPPQPLRKGDVVDIDASSRASLELTKTLSGERMGSLMAVIDRTASPAGSRLLAERLASPLRQVEAIERRLSAVAWLGEDKTLRAELRALLRGVPDLARAVARLALERGGPRDLGSVMIALEIAAEIDGRLVGALPADLAAALAKARAVDGELAAALGAALASDLPLLRRDGGFVRPGFDPELDELRSLRDDSRKVIAGLQTAYAEKAEIRQLRIKHNNFLGYFIEVPQAQGETLLRAPFNTWLIHRQTMADAMRFSTEELAALQSKIAAAQDQALARELAIFETLRLRIVGQAVLLRQMAEALAEIDVSAALAELAIEQDWTRPLVDYSRIFRIEGGRHPVVEAARKSHGTPFVGNDSDLSPPKGDSFGRIALITGPNMAGKSTYLRQNALIAILAQIGSFVPARHAHIGVVDCVFSRVGAADDLARGQSTFMVEMVETAAILNRATPQSLVILDELGRGTATFDGLSIAWAAIEYLHESCRARTLFATHFHELTQLTRTLPRLTNLTMRVAEWKGEVVFLHEVVAGAADRSYGIQVAKLAGLPVRVIERARLILSGLEAGERRQPAGGLIDDLPLFAPSNAPPPPDPIGEALDRLDPDALTPREALELAYRLKQLRAAAQGRA